MRGKVEDFLRFKRDDAKSPGTVDTYRKHLVRYARFCERRPDERVNDRIGAYLDSLAGCVDQTKASHLRTIKAFYAWLGEPVTIRRRWKPAPPRVPPEHDDVVRLLQGLPSATFADRRARIAIALTYLTGARIGEISSLEWTQVDLTRLEAALFAQKTNNYRVVYLVGPIPELLREWRAETPGHFVFPAMSGPHGHAINQAMSYSNLQTRWRKHQDSLGATKPISLHMLRFAFASNMRAAGADPRDIQECLGHSSPRMTNHYIKATSRHRRESNEKFASDVNL